MKLFARVKLNIYGKFGLLFPLKNHQICRAICPLMPYRGGNPAGMRARGKLAWYYSQPMKRHIETTKDGSSTLRVEGWDEPYHSVHGAIQESRHVFIESGLKHCNTHPLRILEMGFGTGLNALLTLLEANAMSLPVHYTGVEAFPVTLEEAGQLNYPQQLPGMGLAGDFERMHRAPWEENLQISPYFTLLKRRFDFMAVAAEEQFDLVYFDVFGARVQPEFWTEVLFEKMYRALDHGGILVTYAAKGSVRRAMQAVGFGVERLPGPPGKREMLRATKP